MTKSELIDALATRQESLAVNDVEAAVRKLVERLSSGERTEIHGFGSFSLRYPSARRVRNPKAGDALALASKYVPHSSRAKNCASGRASN